ncbi:MAG: Rieske 2Fe-2S domain-containing protein [Acidobacteria bacterium]|nr:Rieske 2Fe-2S domain-containing protein [Acidobacteriota bacterium]
MDFEFDERLAYAATLPARFYFGAETLAAERECVFAASWQLVGRSDQLPASGSYFTTEIVGEPLLIVRDQANEIRGFYNVCRHRAGRVAESAGCRSMFRCTYHGWSYALDGRLLGVPEFDGVQNFDKADFGLKPIRTAVWEQFIFVNLSNEAEDLPAFFGNIQTKTQRFNISQMKLAERREYVIACNWKVYVDNYLEGYHVPVAHPSLMRELNYANYRTITHRYHSLQDAPLKQDARVYPADNAEALYYWVFPNLMLNVYPDNLSTNLIVPLDDERTLTIFEWYFHEADPARVAQTIKFSDEIQQEDIYLCENVQRGLRSRSYDRGRYSARRENGVHHFHSLWREFMTA